jgi:zinc protease
MRADLSPQRTQRPTEAPPWTSVLSVVSFLLLLPALAGAIGPAVVEDRLPNGAALLVSEQRNLPMVLVRVVLDAGARRDPQGKAGLANLTADLLTEGTSTRSAQQIKDAIDFIGGALQTSADTDYAVASLQVLRKDLDTGLALLADVLLHPAFKADELARRREAVLASIRAQQDDPTTVAQKAFQPALYGDTPYGHPDEGTEASLPGITRADVQAFFARHYGPSGAGIVVVGDISPAEAHDRLGKALGAWRGEPLAPFVYPPVPDPSARQIRIDRPVTQAAIVMGNLGIERASPDYEAVSVMNYVLGSGGFSSRLTDSIRTQAGLAYSVSSFFAAMKAPGPFEIVMQTKNASVAEAITRAREQVEKIRNEPVSDDELQEAKRYLTGSFPLRLDSNNKIADFIAQAWFYALGMNYADTYIERVNAVTLADVQRVAQAYLHPERFIEVVVTNPEDVAQ